MKTATSYRARALVVECMALQPLLQWLCESKLIQATHAVITNTRADHIDIMGPTDHDVALALAGMIPENGKVYTNERRLFTILENVARDRSAAITPITPADVAAVTEDDMRGFSYVEHPENVALALQVCEDLGVARDVALTGMRNVEPDAGALLVYQLDFFGRHICFVNGFAANDPESTAIIWHMMIQRYPEIQKRIAIFNCRDDRVDRSWQLGSACVNWMPADHYLLVGTGTFVFARAMVKHGMDMTKVVIAEDRRADDIFETFIGFAGRTSLVMGMGNIGGVGLDLVNYFRNRSEPENGV